jgi:hypothetical protein
MLFGPMPIIERMIVWKFGNLPMYQCLLWNWWGRNAFRPMPIIERMVVWEFGNGRGEKFFAPMPVGDANNHDDSTANLQFTPKAVRPQYIHPRCSREKNP